MWWIPLCITIALFTWCMSVPSQSGGTWMPDFTVLFRFGGATIVSLVAWLVWALAT